MDQVIDFVKLNKFNFLEEFGQRSKNSDFDV